MIVFPGGQPGAKNLSESEMVITMLQKQNHDRKFIASICASPAVVLNKAGILSERKVTCYPGTETQLDRDVTLINDCVVVDGNIITSQGPGTAFEFSLTLATLLTDKEEALEVGKATLYYPQ